MQQPIPLSKLLTYKNELVIKLFSDAYPKYAEQADLLFEEMLKYLWLCEQHEYEVSVDSDNASLKFLPVMHPEMLPIDLMWHQFILITRDYADFCHQYFGKFIHHVPNIREALSEQSEADFLAQTSLMVEYIYDKLGAETVMHWFAINLQSDAA